MSPIKNVVCYRGSHKEFPSQNLSFSLLQRRFLFIKSKNWFLLKTFLHHREQEFGENILNF
jgi:hypothetical protein